MRNNNILDKIWANVIFFRFLVDSLFFYSVIIFIFMYVVDFILYIALNDTVTSRVFICLKWVWTKQFILKLIEQFVCRTEQQLYLHAYFIYTTDLLCQSISPLNEWTRGCRVCLCVLFSSHLLSKSINLFNNYFISIFPSPIELIMSLGIYLLECPHFIVFVYAHI